MSEQTTEQTVQNGISEALDEVLSRLTIDQIRYVVARQQCATDAEAARAIGRGKRTVYNWGDDVRLAVRLMAQDGMATALHIRRKHLAEAMLVKTDGLKSDEERIRQGVATELIEWEMGKATQRNEVEQSGELVVRVEYVKQDNPTAGATPGPAADNQ